MENFDDNLIEAAQREAREEMGIGLEILDENPFILHTTKETPEGKIDVILVHYLAKKIGDISPGEDIRKWEWISLNAIEKENLAPNILPTLGHFGFIK